MTVVIAHPYRKLSRLGAHLSPLDTFYYHIDKSRVELRWQGLR